MRNLRKLSRLPIGATFSVPGAGKTTEAICFFLLHRKAQERLLVICPKNAFAAWEEQFAESLGKSAPKIIRLTQPQSKLEAVLKNNDHGVYLITYQKFIRSVDLISSFLQNNRCFVFLDESHRMKGGDDTGTGRQIQKISFLPYGKLIMTGTPMPNDPSDIVPQYQFLFPEQSDLTESNVIERLQKIYVRTTKSELGLDLRKVKEVKMAIPMNEAQKNLYDLVRSEELRNLKGINVLDRRVYRQLSRSYMRLLQIVSNPALLLNTGINIEPNALREAIEYGDSNKVKYVALRARKLAREGKKVLIWSGFVGNVELLTQMLADLGAQCIHGGVDAGSEEEEGKREFIVKKFHDDPNAYVLVANPAACSEGISLHKVCHHAIYLDRNYNAAQYLQSKDRIHRLGLDPNIETTIEIVYSPDSIDQLVDARLAQKINRMSQVLEDPNLRYEPVLKEFDLDIDGFDDEAAQALINHLKSI